EPLGQRLAMWGREGTIVGVVEDFHMRSFYAPIEPVIIRLSPGNTWMLFTNNERFNFAPFNLVLTPNERTSIYAQTNYELTDNITLYAKGLFNKRKSTNQAAPEPIFIGPGAGTGGLPDTVVVDATNPFNPFGVTFDPAGAGPLSFNFFGRRPIEFGPRIFEQDVNTMYVGAGLEGNFNAAGRSFFWDVNLVYSENRADQIKQGAIDARKLAIALGPVDECNADPACVPFNIFGGQNGGSPAPAPNTELGPGTITQEMIDFVGFTQKDVSEQRLRAYSANITGDIVELPAGPLSFAAGVETRREDGFFQPDAIVAAGDSNGIPANPTSGAYDVDEYYAELNIPLLAGKPWAELLDISVAARTSDYSTFGSDTNSKFGFRYRPNRQLLIRGTFAEGLRAPTIGELFGSQTRFDATLTDPCSAPIATAALAANCASLGVPAGFVQANPQISVFTGGNPDLEPETSDTITIGAVYSPS
ncbi:MAG: TonB-dependent receptor, partial [Gammaproteobacteria bacterium]|nr:TonB-dependent receptor [Gammaproteobacteria bacterium]